MQIVNQEFKVSKSNAVTEGHTESSHKFPLSLFYGNLTPTCTLFTNMFHWRYSENIRETLERGMSFIFSGKSYSNFNSNCPFNSPN